MAKSLRSKIKRHFRKVKGKTVSSNPTYQSTEEKKAALLESIVNAPKPERPDGAMTGDAVMDDDMEVELTTKNPAKIARKLRERRLAKLKGQHKVGSSSGKKSNPLAGANQFHKRKSKKRR